MTEITRIAIDTSKSVFTCTGLTLKGRAVCGAICGDTSTAIL